MPACAVLYPDLPERRPGYGTVVEGEDLGTDDLICLVAFAGDDDYVAGPGPGEGAADCGLPVGNCLMPVHGQAARYAGGDLGDDGFRPLAARVVRGDPHAIAQPRGDAAHERPLAAVAIPAAAEDHAQASVSSHELARGLERALEGVGSVRVVDHEQEWLARLDPLEAPGHRS